MTGRGQPGILWARMSQDQEEKGWVTNGHNLVEMVSAVGNEFHERIAASSLRGESILACDAETLYCGRLCGSSPVEKALLQGQA